MPSLYEDYVRFYLLLDYSRNVSEFYARLQTREIPEKDNATIPEPEASDREDSEPMLQSMVQNGSDTEDDTWGNWTAQGKSQQTPSQAPSTYLGRAKSDSRETSNRIARRIRILLSKSYKCFSQACCQAESMIVSKKCLTNIELDKIKAACTDKCCKPADSSASATRWINAPISEAATEHSESPVAATKDCIIRQLLTLANENPRIGEAATEHSEIPEAACQEAKRSRKSGKGSFSQSQKMLCPRKKAKTTTQVCEH